MNGSDLEHRRRFSGCDNGGVASSIALLYARLSDRGDDEPLSTVSGGDGNIGVCDW